MKKILFVLLLLSSPQLFSSEIKECEQSFVNFTKDLVMIYDDSCKSTFVKEDEGYRITASNFTFGRAEVLINMNEIQNLYMCNYREEEKNLELRYRGIKGEFVTLILQKDKENNLEQITVSRNLSYVWCKK